MIYLKDAPISWHPRNKPNKWVPGVVVEDQRAEESPIVIRLCGNQQLLSALPDLVRPRVNWTGHEFEENGQLFPQPRPPGPLIELPMLSAVERAELDREVRDDRTRDAAGLE